MYPLTHFHSNPGYLEFFSLQSPFNSGDVENKNYLFTVNSSTLSTSAASLSPEQQRLGDEHDDGGVTAKEKDGKIKARTAMRRLARLVEATEGVTKAEELFVVANFYMLEQGIHNVCQTDADSDKQSKAGLKVAIGSLIRVAAKSVIANFIITNRIDDSKQVEMFVKVLI